MTGHVSPGDQVTLVWSVPLNGTDLNMTRFFVYQENSSQHFSASCSPYVDRRTTIDVCCFFLASNSQNASKFHIGAFGNDERYSYWVTLIVDLGNGK